ncbi:MAG: hypothetical protein NC324_03050 [Bacteroides sp.]|nr:hypothetical protein [Bacteroides sp.]
MEEDNGRLNFVPHIDNAPIRQESEGTKSTLRSIGTSAEESGRQMDDAMKRAAQNATASVRNMAESVKASQNQAQQAVTSAVTASEKQMDRLQQAFQRGFNIDETSITGIKQAIQTQISYIKEVEKEYANAQKAIKNVAPGNERGNMEKELAEQKRAIEEEKAALNGLKAKYDELSSNTMPSLRTQIMQTVNQLAIMRMEGKQNTDEYHKLEAELGRLATIQREVRNNMTSDSTGATQWTGIIQGVQGLMGAYSAASGVVGLFTQDQEKLMKVQTRMQSVMGILMGMQQVANTLHSTSTFRLRTLAKAQELYTLAVNKTKVALLSGSAAAKTFKLALASTGVGLLVVALGALVSAISKMKAKAKEAAKEAEELKKALDIKFAGIGEAAKATTEINAYTAALENANLSKIEEKKLIDELNSKYGNIIGQYKTKAEWLDALKGKTEDYIESLRLQAQAEAAVKQAMEAADKEEEAKKKVETVTSKNQPLIDKNKKDYDYFVSQGNNNLAANLAKQNKKLQKEIDDANEELDKAIRHRMESFAKLDGLKVKQIENSIKLGGTEGVSDELQKQLDEIDRLRQAGQKSINANEIALMQEGKAKKLAQIEAERADMLAAIEKERKDLEKKLKEAGQGGLTEKDRQTFEVRTTQINTIQDNKRVEVEKESEAEIARMYKTLSDVFITEEQRKVNAIKERYGEQRKELKKQKEGGSISEELYIDLSSNVDNAEAKEMADYWLQAYGNYDQKRQALDDEWRARLKDVPPEFAAEAERQMTEALSKLDLDQFKQTIDWSGVFGNLGEQSSPAIQFNLGQIQAYFDANKGNMGIDEIKELQQAITTMQSELDSRNPFAGLINSIKGISDAKEQAVAAIEEIKAANDELALAKEEQRIAQEEVDAYDTSDGDAETINAKIEAEMRLAEANRAVATATEKKNAAEKKGLTAANSLTAGYRKFSKSLSSTKNSITGVANNAKDLAAVFSDDVADGIGKAIDLFDTVMDSATDVIDSIASVGKSAGEAVTSTVAASSTAMQATSTAAATSISTVEKASVILTVISAALQVATAIASLFGNGDEQKEKEIESLQKRIDQLQWEMDNAAIIRVQGGEGAESVVDEIKQKYIESAEEIRAAYNAAMDSFNDELSSNAFVTSNKVAKMYAKAMDSFSAEKAKIVSKELVKDFSNIKYSADKVFGKEYWDQAGKNAQNYAEQMVLMEQQLEAEKSKKKTDKDKVKELEQQIAETKQKINDEFNNAVEEILGGSYEDIADTLGNAFFDAFEAGEDAAKAWADAVDGIIADVIKRMMIQMILQEQVANRMDNFKKKVYKDGKYQEDAVLDAALELGEGLKEDYANFSDMINKLPDDIKEYFTSSTREAAEKGIQSITQDTADEMNGRITAIQSHTYTINENTKLLVANTSQILVAVVQIQENTELIYRFLSGTESELRELKTTVNSMNVRGLKLL